MKRQKGFSVIEGLLIVVVLAIIGAVGYLAYSNLWASKGSDTNSSVAAVKVESQKDLDKVDSALDQLTVDDSELGQLDSALNNF